MTLHAPPESLDEGPPEGSALTPTEPPTRSRTRGRLGFNMSVLAAGQAVTWLMSLVWTVVVPRALGPAAMGVLVAAWSATAILGVVLGLGTRNFLVREIVASPHRTAGLVGTALMLRLCLVPIFVAAVFAYTRFASFNSRGQFVLYLAMGATVLTLLTEPMQAMFQADERMHYLAISDVISKTVQGLGGVALAAAGFGATGLTACWLVVAGAVLLLNLRWGRSQVPLSLRSNLPRLRAMVTDSLPYWAFGVFYMLYLWIDSVILSLMVPPEVVGWYGVPTKLFTTLMFVPVIVSTAWLPRLVAAFERSPGALRTVARAPVEAVVIASLPILVCTVMTARPLIGIVYGAQYANAVPVMVVLALCLPPMYLNTMLNQALIAAKRPMVWTWVMAGAAIVNPVVNVVLIKATQARYHNGAIGAAASLLATEVIIAAVGMWIIGRRILPGSFLWRLFRAALVATAMAAAMAVTRALGPFVTAPFGAAVFVAGALVSGVITPDERAALSAAARRVRSRIHVPRLERTSL